MRGRGKVLGAVSARGVRCPRAMNTRSPRSDRRRRVCAVSTIEVSERSFQYLVLDRSTVMPVVVDFWAPWCAPCLALTPLLQDAVAARTGEVVLAKVDIDL